MRTCIGHSFWIVSSDVAAFFTETTILPSWGIRFQPSPELLIFRFVFQSLPFISLSSPFQACLPITCAVATRHTTATAATQALRPTSLVLCPADFTCLLIGLSVASAVDKPILPLDTEEGKLHNESSATPKHGDMVSGFQVQGFAYNDMVAGETEKIP